MTSGRAWKRVQPQPKLASANVNETILVVDNDDTTCMAYFKWPKPGSPHGCLYSIGMERVFYELAYPLGVPMCDTYLEKVEGHHGLVSMRAPGAKSWRHLANDITDSEASFFDRDTWPVAVGIDVLLGNNDRHEDNVYVQWDPPQKRPAAEEQCGTWFIDFGHSGLFPTWKFDRKLGPADILQIAETADLLPEELHKYRNRLPSSIRKAFPLKGTPERALVVETVRTITEDRVDEVFSHIPAPYITPAEEELTARWIKARLQRVDTLIDYVFPT